MPAKLPARATCSGFSEHSGFAASGSAASQNPTAAPDKPYFDDWGSALHRLFMEGNPF